MRATTLITILLLIITLPACAHDKVADWVAVRAEDAQPVGSVVYHRTFELDFEPTEGYLKFTCYTPADFGGTSYRSFVNSIQGPGGSYWMDVQYVNLAGVIHKGTNSIDIEVTWAKNGTSGPVLVKLFAKGQNEDGEQKSITIRSDSSWVYYPGPFKIRPKDSPEPPSKQVAVAGAADTWVPAKSPLVLPKLSTAKVVGVTSVKMKGGNAGSLYQFNLVRDYSDKFYFLDALGYYSIEDYIFGQTNYQQPGTWFWGYDKQIAHNQERAGYDFTVYPWVWVPAEWYCKQEQLPMVKCIEHGEEGFGLSLWSPLLMEFNNNIYRELKTHFGDRIKFIYPGIYGDFGEAHYMAGWNPWMNPKPEHQHAGFWAGDDLARADFRRKMMAKYGSLDALNAAWKTSFASQDEIMYPSLDGSDPRCYSLDFINWYYDCMTDFTLKVCEIAKTTFPGVPVAPKLGCGDENPMWGQDNSAIPEVLAKIGVGVRSTHGSSPNFAVRRLSSACKFYGNFFETETAGGTNRAEASKKFFIDASSGCTEIFEYPNAIIKVADIFSDCRRYLRGQHSITEIALFFPTSWHRANLRKGYPPRLVQAAEEIRDVLDFDVVDENMLLDGALDHYRVLAMFDGDFTEKAVYDRLMAWVDRGGTLLLLADQLPYSTVEGDVLPISELAQEAADGGAVQSQGEGQILVWSGNWDERSEYYELIYSSAYPLSSDGGDGALDGKADGVWTSLFKNYALYLNNTDAPVTVQENIPEEFAERVGLSYQPQFLSYAIEIPPHGQAVHFFDRPFAEFVLECEDMQAADKLPDQVIYKGGGGELGKCVRIAEGKSVGAAFNIEKDGEYGVSCIIEPTHHGIAQLEIDGKKTAVLRGPTGPHNYMYPLQAKVHLKRGKHTISICASEGEHLADKVILTTDTDLAGFSYGFVDLKADQTW